MPQAAQIHKQSTSAQCKETERMNVDLLRAHLYRPVSRTEITQQYCRGKSVLDIGCVNHNIQNVDAENWQHGAIVRVASDALGIDYLQEEVQELAQRGFRVMAADITKPIQLNERFDVIVIGHLIEHLSAFDGLMTNVRKLLKTRRSRADFNAKPFL